MTDQKEIKNILFDKLKQGKYFWSYDMKDVVNIPDDILIEKVLIHLDIDEINLLFRIFPKKEIKKIWRERVAIQGDYYKSMNLLYAWYYFDIKRPEKYIKTIETQYLNSFL